MSKKEIAFELFKGYAFISLIEDLRLNIIVLKLLGLNLNGVSELITLFLLLVLLSIVFDYISKDWK